jgi:phosphate transport system substrate-binding protein
MFAPGSSNHRIDIVGSTSVQPLAEKLANTYMKNNSNVLINVQGGGSGMGIRSIQQKITNMGMVSAELSQEDKKGITVIKLGDEGIVVCVNNENNISNLTTQQIRDIFSGKIDNWKDVGGANSKIHVITREDGSGTRTGFETILMKGYKIKKDAIVQSSTNEIEQSVVNDNNAIGYVSYTTISNNVKDVLIDGVKVSDDTIVDGSYKLIRPYLFLIHDHDDLYVNDFLNWVFSPEGLEIIKHEKIIPPNGKELEDTKRQLNNITTNL